MNQKEIMKNKQVSHRKKMSSIICSISNIQDSKTDKGIAIFLGEGTLELLLMGIKMIKQNEKVLAICIMVQSL